MYYSWLISARALGCGSNSFSMVSFSYPKRALYTSAGETSTMQKQTGTIQVKRNFPEMLKGGVICDVVNADHARIAEEAGAAAVMALERVPADIRAQGGVARMSDPELIIQIKE